MTNKLAVVVLGHRKSGKSTTWYTLFGGHVRTGSKVRPLWLSDSEWTEVFLVSGSPEERKTDVAGILGGLNPTIVLCSAQYVESVRQTINYFSERDYALFVQWLNPGYSDVGPVTDTLGLVPYLLDLRATVCLRDGKVSPESRVRELREFMYGWASSRKLINRAGTTDGERPDLEHAATELDPGVASGG